MLVDKYVIFNKTEKSIPLKTEKAYGYVIDKVHLGGEDHYMIEEENGIINCVSCKAIFKRISYAEYLEKIK